MLQSHSNIFVILADMARLIEEQTPYPSNDKNILLWQNNYHTSLKQLLKDMELEEKTVDITKNFEGLLYKMFDKFYKYATINTPKVYIDAIIKHIMEERHQVEQRSAQWYEEFGVMLTASEFHKLFDSERTRGQLVLSKVTPRAFDGPKAVLTEHMKPMDWGIRFEPIIKQYLENSWNCQIYECGRMKHTTEKRLGASPDGIIISEGSKYGRLVEIKCPYSRKVGLGIPQDYWIQMQIQMEVTNLMECEYVEVEILSKNPKNLNPTFEKIDGEIYLLEKDGIYSYNYDKTVGEAYTLVEIIPYAITKVHNELVLRNKTWYEETIPKQNAFWEDVEKAKKGTFVLVEPRTKKPKPCLIIDNE